MCSISTVTLVVSLFYFTILYVWGRTIFKSTIKTLSLKARGNHKNLVMIASSCLKFKPGMSQLTASVTSLYKLA